ncbi:putative transposase, partial [Escherichia coli BCE032_MS-12]
LRPQSVTSRIQPGSDVIVCAEMDEQWGYVGAKSRQRWLFYAYDRIRRTVVAHVFGERTLATLARLLSLLSAFEVVVWMTDGWPLYESRLKGKLHVISKRYTQRIERHNLRDNIWQGWDGSHCRSQNRWSCMTRSSGII